MKSTRHVINVVALTMVILISAEAAPQKADNDRDQPFHGTSYDTGPSTFWRQLLRDRNEDKISLAFDRVRSQESGVWVTVPALARIVGAPFPPIDFEKDSLETMASKIQDLAVRVRAIDVLAEMGQSASSATPALIRWALMPRIVSGNRRTADEDDLFIALVVVDAQQKIRVAAAIAEFGRPAYPVVAALLTSHDSDARKLAVAILNEQALRIAGKLLRSDACEDRSQGVAIFEDLNLIVSQEYLDELRKRLCSIRTD